jgi:hypothetical protein
MVSVGSDKHRDVVPIERIENLVIDLCGVLYDNSEWKRWLLGLVTRMGLHTHYAPFFRVWEREFYRANRHHARKSEPQRAGRGVVQCRGPGPQ